MADSEDVKVDQIEMQSQTTVPLKNDSSIVSLKSSGESLSRWNMSPSEIQRNIGDLSGGHHRRRTSNLCNLSFLTLLEKENALVSVRIPLDGSSKKSENERKKTKKTKEST